MGALSNCHYDPVVVGWSAEFVAYLWVCREIVLNMGIFAGLCGDLGFCDCAGGEVPVDAEVKQWSEDWDAAGNILSAYHMPTVFFTLLFEKCPVVVAADGGEFALCCFAGAAVSMLRCLLRMG